MFGSSFGIDKTIRVGNGSLWAMEVTFEKVEDKVRGTYFGRYEPNGTSEFKEGFWAEVTLEYPYKENDEWRDYVREGKYVSMKRAMTHLD